MYTYHTILVAAASGLQFVVSVSICLDMPKRLPCSIFIAFIWQQHQCPAFAEFGILVLQQLDGDSVSDLIVTSSLRRGSFVAVAHSDLGDSWIWGAPSRACLQEVQGQRTK